jgi:hypothetical protein
VFALDGCKISSNAAKEYSGTFKELKKKKEKLSKMLKELMNKHIQGDKRPEDIEKRKKKYEEKINKIDDFLNCSEPKMGARKRELKSNVTDNESAKMKTSHGVIQGYNGLAVVDEKTQVIVAAEAYGQGAEHNLLEPMVKQAEDNLKQAQKKETIGGAMFIADTNYFSEDNNRYCEEKKLDAYIPDQYFRNRDPRFEKDYPRRKGIRKNLFTHEDFTFDEKVNCFMCPAGKKLSYDGKKNIHGYKGRRYVGDKKECANCNLKPRCLKKNAGRRHLFIVDIPKPKTYSEKMMEKIDTAKGRDIYSKRMGIVEPVFANITVHKGLSRFTLRTKKKVNIQWLLYCMLHNMGKIARKSYNLIRNIYLKFVSYQYSVVGFVENKL